ncbi:MAG: glycosyltransferase [Bacteroidia bacterium]|nr:glycosyltransferase [Bacteroidia bacterium]
MAKVLHIVNRLNLGGITYNAASIAAGLRPEYDTMIVAGMKDDSEESSEFMVRELGLEPVFIPDMYREINLKADYKAYRQLLRLIRAFKPDIVHTHAAKAGLLGRLAARRAGVPVILHTFHGHVFHSYFGKAKTRFFLETERFLARLSTGIIAISETQKKELCETYKVCDCSKIHVVELGYDLEPFLLDMESKRKQFRERFSIGDDTLAVGIIGRIVPIKNLRFFIDAWIPLHEKFGQKIKAFLVGDGEQRFEIQEYCISKGLKISTPEKTDPEASVVFTSWIYPVDRVMAGIDLVALCSLNEGTPASLIEAQAAGKPIVSTEVGGISNIVLPGKTALLCPSGDTAKFREALEKLINDAALRQNMQAEGPGFAVSRFHYKRLTSDIRGLYARLLNIKRPVQGQQ